MTKGKKNILLGNGKINFRKLLSSLVPHYATHIEKCEALQKSAIKWMNGESFASYSSEKYNNKLKSLKILPLKKQIYL